MTRHCAFVVPGAPEQLTGGYLYDRHIVHNLRLLDWQVDVHGLAGCFPLADETGRAALDRCLQSLPDRLPTVIDGLALGALPEVVAAHSYRLALVALIHHPLADESGLDVTTRHDLERREREALGAVRHVVTTSRFTARRLEHFAVTTERISVIEPGVVPAPLASAAGHPPRLLSVGSVVPRKGHQVLVAALARLAALAWQCRIVGSTARDPVHARALGTAIAQHGLSDRIHLCGELSPAALQAEYGAADLFVLPSLYEGFGMVVLEALAHGLPLLSTDGGALADTVPPGAGIVVPAGDVDALANALQRLVTDRPLRLRTRNIARKLRHDLPDWAQAGKQFSNLLMALQQ